METVTIVGYLAALSFMTIFTPQARKIINTRDTSSISAPMYGLTVSDFGLWLTFGLMKDEWPIIITNGVCYHGPRRKPSQTLLIRPRNARAILRVDTVLSVLRL